MFNDFLSILLISIHAPRVGSDGKLVERLYSPLIFQSTLPVWGATFQNPSVSLVSMISIHAPRVGSDFGEATALLFYNNFNPRSPCGERQQKRTEKYLVFLKKQAI